VIGVISALAPGSREHAAAGSEACILQCEGIILQTIQFSGLFNDSKTFVDMPLLWPPEDIQKDFHSMSSYEPHALKAFVDRNFAPSCSDMFIWSPPDYVDEPAFLNNITDPTFKEWALDVHSLWNLLGRQMDPDVVKSPRLHTLLPLRSPFMIVPGGRFCEFYYWDTYWIIQGLLVSGMHSTAQIIVDNLVGMVEDFGFVPNGSRRYYLNRSQPPMLTLMVKEVYEATVRGEDNKSGHNCSTVSCCDRALPPPSFAHLSSFCLLFVCLLCAAASPSRATWSGCVRSCLPWRPSTTSG